MEVLLHPLEVLSLLGKSAAGLGLIAVCLYLSHTLAERLLPTGSGLALRWAGTAAAGMWLAQVGFHGLAAVGIFQIGWALILGVLASGLTMRISPLPVFGQALLRDGRTLARRLRWLATTPFRWVFLPALLLALLTALRASLLPNLGWDSLTYHTPKAAFWVQAGGYTTLPSPGGWGQYYQNLFGGGEIFSAWAMLPFHNDLLVGWVDVVQWVFLGLALYTFGRTLALKPALALLGAVYVLFIPAVWYPVGSGYVDNGLNLALTLGLVFSIQAVKTRQYRALLLAGMAFGTAVAVKVVVLPAAGLVFLVLLGYTAWPKNPPAAKSHPLFPLLAAGLAGALMVVPWLAINLQQTGLPLAGLPVQVGGLRLGDLTPTLAWYQERPELAQTGLAEEVVALARMFRSPLTQTPHLSVLSLVSLLLFPVMVVRWLRQSPSHEAVGRLAGLLALAVTIGVLLYFYQPAFKVIRLLWPLVTARFLLPVFTWTVFASLALFHHPKKTNPHAWFIAASALLHMGAGAFFGWAGFEYVAAAVWGGVLILAPVLLAFLAKAGRVRTAWAVGLVLCLAAGVGLSLYRAETRYQAAVESLVYDPVHTYWVPTAAQVDQPGAPVTVAITAGPHQNADNWFMAFFMGSELQNTLVYLPVAAGGEIVDFYPPGELEESANQEAWLARLEQHGVDYVMSFEPASIELAWMESQPARFERVSGSGQRWGLYRVIP